MRRYYWYTIIGVLLISAAIFAAAFIKNYTPGLNVAMAHIDKKSDINYEDVHIIFNTIPKSASVYISRVLAHGLNSDLLKIAPGYFPHDHLLYGELENFYKQKYAVTKAHLDSSNFNMQMLKKFTDRIVVQFRDPREVLLSWIHYVQRIHDEGKIEYLYHFSPTPPEEYYTWPISRQVDWNIEYFLPSAVTWMQDWLNFKEHEDQKPNGFKVLITTYDQFKENERNFYAKILDFYNIPREQFTFIHMRLDMDVHFRSGDQNEWRTVYTPAQLSKINKISRSLLEKFNWQLN